MNNYQKSQLFRLSLIILSLKNTVKFYNNMLYYLNLEHGKLNKEIKKHDKEFEMYTRFKNGKKIDISVYSNLSALIECEKLQTEYKQKIKTIQAQIKKCENSQKKMTGENEDNNSNLNKIFNN